MVGWTDGPAFTGILFRLCVSSNFIRVLAQSLFRKTGSFSGKHKLYIPHYSSVGTYLEMKHCIAGVLTFFRCSRRAVFFPPLPPPFFFLICICAIHLKRSRIGRRPIRSQSVRRDWPAALLPAPPLSKLLAQSSGTQ